MDVAISVNGVPIRLTTERWAHVVESHDEMAGRVDDVLATLESPDWITRGNRGTLRAWKGFGRDRFLVVIYRELTDYDGFVITAFFATKARKRNRIWPSPS